MKKREERWVCIWYGRILQQEFAKGDLGGDLALGPDLLSTDKGLLDDSMESPAHVRGDLVLEFDDLLGDDESLFGVPDHKVCVGANGDRALDAAQSNLAGGVEALPLCQILNTILLE